MRMLHGILVFLFNIVGLIYQPKTEYDISSWNNHFLRETATADFKVYWNAPTQSCRRKFGVDVDTSRYGIISNVEDGWRGDNITIFPRLGLFPHVADNGSIINGGIPQNVDLTEHTEAIKNDVARRLPDDNFHGLAIVDYEAWQPLWSLNYDSREVYKHMSIDLVTRFHPEWPHDKIQSEAKNQFQKSARKFLELTMKTVQEYRPQGKWGYYHFPYCFNGDRPNKIRCGPETPSDNDRLLWLFESEDILYPSAYLHSSENITLNGHFVAGRLKEARRVQQKIIQQKKAIQMYLYVSIQYVESRKFYTVADLDNTLKQALALGLDGVILWGDHHLAEDHTSCSGVKLNLDQTLGPYVQKLLDKRM